MKTNGELYAQQPIRRWRAGIVIQSPNSQWLFIWDVKFQKFIERYWYIWRTKKGYQNIKCMLKIILKNMN